MFAGVRAHVRANLVAYVALFFALSGTGAYASHLVVRSSDIVNGTVQAVDLKNGAATNTKIATNAVGVGKIAPNAVTGVKIAPNAVTGAKIAPGAVGPSDLAAVPHARALQTSAQAFPNLTQTQVNIDTIQFSSEMTLAGNALVVSVPGLYLVSGMIDWTINGTGGRALELTRNSISIGAGDIVQAAPATFGNTLHDVSALIRLDAGDTIQFFASQNSGGSLSTAVVGGIGATLSAVWVGP